MDLKKQFESLVEQFKDDIEYISEGIIIDVTEQIHKQMKEKNITRSQLAQKLGCSNAYITKLLNGGENLTLKKIVQIAHALECSIDFVLLPKQYEMKRHITFNTKKLDTTGYSQQLNLEDAYEQRNGAIAA